MHSRLGSVICVVDVQHDLLGRASVGGREGLVVFAEDEGLRDRGGVLCDKTDELVHAEVYEEGGLTAVISASSR